jgi:hypothetical protein
MLMRTLGMNFLSAQRRLHALSLVFCVLGTSCQTLASEAGELSNDPLNQRQRFDGSIKSDCNPFKHSDGFMSVKASFSGSGKYCLTEDLVQRRFFDIVEGRKNVTSPKRNGVISAFDKAHDLDIDLQGHLVTGAPFDDTTGLAVGSLTQNVKFHNGVVRTPGSKGIGVAMAPYKDPGQFFWPSPDDESPMMESRYNREPPNRIRWPRRHHVRHRQRAAQQRHRS